MLKCDACEASADIIIGSNKAYCYRCLHDMQDWQLIATMPRAHMPCEMRGTYTDELSPGLYAFRATHWRPLK